MSNNDQYINNISRNIKLYGWHVYVVQQDTCPRFLYTIGLCDIVGFELVFAGAILYDMNQSIEIINRISKKITSDRSANRNHVNVNQLGLFSLKECDKSWSSIMLLGAMDYYNTTDIFAMQIFPNSENMTIDTPDLSNIWSPLKEPAWRWLKEPWNLPIPSCSTATTNLSALRGEKITEASRWEEDEWEMFAGPGSNTREEDMRVAPVGVLLAADTSLSRVISLKVGESVWRSSGESAWHDWVSG